MTYPYRYFPRLGKVDVEKKIFKKKKIFFFFDNYFFKPGKKIFFFGPDLGTLCTEKFKKRQNFDVLSICG